MGTLADPGPMRVLRRPADRYQVPTLMRNTGRLLGLFGSRYSPRSVISDASVGPHAAQDYDHSDAERVMRMVDGLLADGDSFDSDDDHRSYVPPPPPKARDLAIVPGSRSGRSSSGAKATWHWGPNPCSRSCRWAGHFPSSGSTLPRPSSSPLSAVSAPGGSEDPSRCLVSLGVGLRTQTSRPSFGARTEDLHASPSVEFRSPGVFPPCHVLPVPRAHSLRPSRERPLPPAVSLLAKLLPDFCLDGVPACPYKTARR